MLLHELECLWPLDVDVGRLWLDNGLNIFNQFLLLGLTELLMVDAVDDAPEFGLQKLVATDVIERLEDHRVVVKGVFIVDLQLIVDVDRAPIHPPQCSK
jgi:hypothetical protein